MIFTIHGQEDPRTVEFVSDRKILSKPCLPCKTVSEGQHIGRRLLEVLSHENDAVGLAANQIGLNSSVCVVTVTKPIILINPEIVGKFGKSFFQEGCLSFKGDYILTERWTDIVVRCDNYRNSLFFSFSKNALECVCVQHEIDHLNGITMFDRAVEKELFDG
jgi:peptide deformylase